MNAGVTDQCIAVAKHCGYESHFITTSAVPLFTFIYSWCLEVGVQYALLMRATKQLSRALHLFLLAPHGLLIMKQNVYRTLA